MEKNSQRTVKKKQGTKNVLTIRRVRYFSEEFKRQKVRELECGQITMGQIVSLYQVSRTAVYNWLYQYSPHHQQGSKQVVEMKSEAHKSLQLLERISELERTIGQKQLEIDYLRTLVDVSSQELGVDLKKNTNIKHSSGSAITATNTTGK